jgi:hypothetical protein
MTELEKVKEEKVTLKIKGKEREIRYGFSEWAVIEEEIGGLDNLDKLQKQVEKFPFKTIPHLIYIGLVDKEGVEESTVLDEYGLGDVEQVVKVFEKALYGSLPEETKKAVKEAK